MTTNNILQEIKNKTKKPQIKTLIEELGELELSTEDLIKKLQEKGYLPNSQKYDSENKHN